MEVETDSWLGVAVKLDLVLCLILCPKTSMLFAHIWLSSRTETRERKKAFPLGARCKGGGQKVSNQDR